MTHDTSADCAAGASGSLLCGNRAAGWELAGVDVGLCSFARWLLPKASVCTRPGRAIDWAVVRRHYGRAAKLCCGTTTLTHAWRKMSACDRTD
jgi:hypothetical protein